MKNIKLLDCTLRDGGYYNNWDFNNNLINDYLKTMDQISMDYVEIGFRAFDDNKKRGPLAYSKDAFLNSLNIPKNISLGVMVNASELIGNNSNVIERTRKLFQNKKKSPVNLVRIACHLNEVNQILGSINLLKKLGYIVGVNVMQISEATGDKISKIAMNLKKVKPHVIYFADSLGSLEPSNIRNIILSIKKKWIGNIGFHAHDNQNLAISNIRVAIHEGASWIDSTVTGMGRGPGNAQTEYVQLLINNDLKKSTSKSLKIEKLIKKYFFKLKEKYKWGANIYYYLSGKYSIHPTYIQEMLADRRYNKQDYYSIIENLKNANAKKYNPYTLRTSNIFYKKRIPKTPWSPYEFFNKKNVLILGSGPRLIKYKKNIENFIKKKDVLVVALNSIQSIKQSFINYRIISHPQRILTDLVIYNKSKQKIIMPLSSIPTQIKKLIKGPKIFDYGMFVEENKFEINKKNCVIPSSHAIAYALSVITAGSVSKIYLAGFDGYKNDKANTILNNEIFNLYKKVQPDKNLVSITPTIYSLGVQNRHQ